MKPQTQEQVSGTFCALVIICIIAVMMAISTMQVHAQTTKRYWERHMYIPGKSKPTFTPTGKDPEGLFYTILNDSTNWIYANGDWKIDTIKNKLAKGDKGDKGDTGPQGPPGASTGSLPSVIDPDNYGAIHQDKTFAQIGKDQAYINQKYPGIGATVNDPVDWAAWQMAVNDATNGKKLFMAWGDFWIRDKKITKPKYGRLLKMITTSYLNVTGSDGSYVLGCEKPTDNSDANQMVDNCVQIDGLEIGNRLGQINRVGIDFGPTYNSVYRSVKCYSLAKAIHLKFQLNTEVSNCTAENCISGWITDMGDWPGASNSNSQSNHSSFRHCRFNGASNSDVAFGIYACSGWGVWDCIVEGHGCKIGIDWDSKGSTVVKGLTVFNTHQEVITGCTVAFIQLRMQGGVAVIDFCYGQYACYMVSATAINGTYPYVEVSHTQYWVPNASDLKFFKNDGCNWALNYNDNLLINAQNATEKFAGKVPAYCLAPVGQCGGNTVTVNIIPR